jgi:hypothetical protein
MSSRIDEEQQERIALLLRSVHSKGVELWSDSGRLRYRAPKGALSRQELDRLRACSVDIVAFLEQVGPATNAVSKLVPRRARTRVPLTFPQLAHWHLYGLDQRPTLRHLAVALRLRGRLDAGLLASSLDQLAQRHESLRTRVLTLASVPMQEVGDTADYEMRVDDLTSLTRSQRDRAVTALIHRLILEPIVATAGPLFGVQLVRLEAEEHVLVLATAHMISDAFSVNILARDLLVLYDAAARGQPPALPPVAIQLADFAAWQSKTHQNWLAAHGAYWRERLRGCGRLRFPTQERASATALALPVSFTIDRSLKEELSEWSRRRRTTLVMAAFTAFVAASLRWCAAREGVFRYQTDGRTSPQMQDAVGFFASILYVRIEVRDADTFGELLERVTREFCEAYEHNDFSYIDAQQPRPDFVSNGVFNWVPRPPQTPVTAESASAGMLTHSRVDYPMPVGAGYDIDVEPGILLYEAEHEIIGSVPFSLSRYSSDSMHRFAQCFLSFLTSLLRHPELRVCDLLH